MEKDPEIKGEGNSYTTEFRQYDPRLGRWLSLDPLMSMFPDMSPYVAFDNNPILFIDPYGLASSTGDGESAGDPPTKNPETGEDWKKGETWYDEGAKEMKEIIGFTEKGEAILGPLRNQDAVITASRANFERELYLQTVSARGSADALYNATVLGGYDLFGGNHLDEYDDLDEQQAYLTGRLAGDATAIIIGASEMTAGGTIALASTATGPGAAIGAPAGAILAGHGAAMTSAATIDNVQTQIQLTKLSAMNYGSGTEESSSSNESGSGEYPNDYSTSNTDNKSATFKSERHARNVARNKIGKDPVQVGTNKWRSRNGKWQYRGKPQDLQGHGPNDSPHIHLEKINPKTGEVLENWHFRW